MRNKFLTLKIQVPVGTKAFFPGVLTHTNQVTVAVGDDYFVKCTTEHARGIITRRLQCKYLFGYWLLTLQVINENLDKCKKEFDFLKAQLGLTSELLEANMDEEGSPFVEIREEYHSDEELGRMSLPTNLIHAEIKTRKETTKKPMIEVVKEEKFEEKLEEEEEKLSDSGKKIESQILSFRNT